MYAPIKLDLPVFSLFLLRWPYGSVLTKSGLDFADALHSVLCPEQAERNGVADYGIKRL